MGLMVIAVVSVSVLVGVSLGLLGGGGSILVVPLLTYLGGMEPREAIASSLFVVGVTSLVSLLQHARARRVRWRTGLLFGVAGMAGAFLGGLVGGHIPGPVLMVAFALMMIVTATAMLRPSRASDAGGTADGAAADSSAAPHVGPSAPASASHPVWRIAVDGLAVGAATGLVGAGGGFLVVPALVLLAGLPMSAAVGTSLLVITMKSFAGLGGYLTTVDLDWPVVLAVTAAAVAGSFVGVALSSRVSEQALRRGFGFFVLAMGVLVLSRELPTAAGAALTLAAVLAFTGAGAMCLVTTRCPFRTPAGRGAVVAGTATGTPLDSDTHAPAMTDSDTTETEEKHHV